jgi:hypothetical protein
VWRDEGGGVEVRFVGRGPELSREATLGAVEADPPSVAALRQIHSARVVEVSEGGFAGEGDALVASVPGLALSVITADCVPVLLAAGDRLAAVHAGWRGIVAGVVPAAVERLLAHSHEDGDVPAGTARAWIGPAIGPCCYEVGPEVAAPVVAASAPDVASDGPAGRPHLDVRRAVIAQLARAGVVDIRVIGPCTRCHAELLWSYRRDGARAGRNIAFVWRRA